MVRKLPSNLVNKKVSRQALVKAFDNWRLSKMEPTKDGPTLTSSGSRQTELQSMDDFMREQNEADALKVAKLPANLAANPTKKQQKAALEAERKTVEQQATEAVKELGAVNWVGKLLEYRNAHPTPPGGLTYAEEVVGFAPARFKCTALIQESSQHFGNSMTFSNKKDAKRFASKKAIDWLIESNYMPADGAVKFPRAPLPPAVKAIGIQSGSPSPAGPPKASTSYAGQVPELCMRLGFNTPTYEITNHSENTPLWSGYAHFSGDPRIEGKVGQVRSVFGKRNAKEQIAIEVLAFLKDIERQRMEMGDKADEEEEDRKRKRESVSSAGIDENSKMVKVEA